MTEQEIDANREKYRPVVYHVTILYFCIMTSLSWTPYQFSLQWFTALFVQGFESRGLGRLRAAAAEPAGLLHILPLPGHLPVALREGQAVVFLRHA